MPLESVTHISDLTTTNPAGTDAKNQGDDHIRNLKVALRTDLPNINGIVNCTPAQLNLLNSIAALTVLANATNGAAAPTALAAASDGLVLRRNGTALAFGVVDSNGGGFHQKYVINDVAYVGTTVLVDVADLSSILTMDADTIYLIEGVLDFTNSGNGAFKFSLVTSQAIQAGRLQTTESGVVNSENNQASFTYTTQVLGAGEAHMVIHTVIHTHATLTSTLKVQAAQGAAVGTTTLKRGSWIRVSKFGIA